MSLKRPYLNHLVHHSALLDPEMSKQGQEKRPDTDFYELNKNIETERNNDGASARKNDKLVSYRISSSWGYKIKLKRDSTARYITGNNEPDLIGQH